MRFEKQRVRFLLGSRAFFQRLEVLPGRFPFPVPDREPLVLRHNFSVGGHVTASTWRRHRHQFGKKELIQCSPAPTNTFLCVDPKDEFPV